MINSDWNNKHFHTFTKLRELQHPLTCENCGGIPEDGDNLCSKCQPHAVYGRIEARADEGISVKFIF